MLSSTSSTKSIGSLLHAARTKLGIKLEDAATELSIQLHFLQAMEEDRFVELPPDPFRIGFLKSYAQFLHIEEDRVVALYRRDYGSPLRTRSQSVFKRIKKSYPVFFSGTSFVVLLFVVLLGFYLSWQWQRALRPPRLVVSYPQHDQEVQTPFVVTGEATSDVVVTVNTIPVSLNPSGEFSLEMELSDGKHSLIIEAKNRRGKTRFVERTIYVVE